MKSLCYSFPFSTFFFLLLIKIFNEFFTEVKLELNPFGQGAFNCFREVHTESKIHFS